VLWVLTVATGARTAPPPLPPLLLLLPLASAEINNRIPRDDPQTPMVAGVKNAG